jgi:hypothetical protein
MSHGPLPEASDPVADAADARTAAEPVDAIVALRLADARQLAAELASWRPWSRGGGRQGPAGRDGGGPDGATPRIRLADLRRPPDLGHPLVVELLHELADLVDGDAARTGSVSAVTVRGVGASVGSPVGSSVGSPGAAARVVVVTASWWSLVARHPGGPVLVLADGSAGVHDLADAPGVAALLDTAASRPHD